MELLAHVLSTIVEPDAAVGGATQRLLDDKTKPRRSLGKLEDVACAVAAARGVAVPEVPVKAIVVMAADHGVAEDGVSAFPQEVTGQMLLNFARGGAAINVLARQVGARLLVVDMGTKHLPAGIQGVRRESIAPGTRNMTREPAMGEAEAVAALETGIRIARELARDGVTLVGLGEMGIGNTTAASALTCALTGVSPDEATGRGTGVDDAGLRRKVDAIRRALALHRPEGRPPLSVLACLGGFEIAGLAGLALGAASERIPVVMDGFIATAAALAAVRLCPAARGHLLASHRSVEAGHRALLTALGTQPLLDLDLRLGEGTGAALAMGMVDAAVRLLREMATFGDAGVSESSRTRDAG